MVSPGRTNPPSQPAATKSEAGGGVWAALGLAAEGEFTLGTDPVEESARLCLKIREKFPRSVFFAGKLLFEAEKWYYPLLHNETAYAISRRLQLQGIPMVVMPIRILKFGG